jgi:hypothetical protein
LPLSCEQEEKKAQLERELAEKKAQLEREKAAAAEAERLAAEVARRALSLTLNP